MPQNSQLVIPSKFDRWIVRDAMSLRFDPKIPEKVFREALRQLVHAHMRVQFYLGDAINFASQRWRRGRYKDFLQESGYAYSRLKVFSWVAQRIPAERRRPELSYSFHEEVARFNPEHQARFLETAVRNQWSTKEFRKYIQLSGKLPAKSPFEPQFGEALNFPGLRRAPINELGVVFLFGLVSQQLGFDVEAVHSAFPDCSAKRLVDCRRNRWKQVRIEFEYRSSNFLLHKHQDKHCDLIICWIHDWPECPIEVIALRDVIHKLRRDA